MFYELNNTYVQREKKNTGGKFGGKYLGSGSYSPVPHFPVGKIRKRKMRDRKISSKSGGSILKADLFYHGFIHKPFTGISRKAGDLFYHVNAFDHIPEDSILPVPTRVVTEADEELTGRAVDVSAASGRAQRSALERLIAKLSGHGRLSRRARSPAVPVIATRVRIAALNQ